MPLIKKSYSKVLTLVHEVSGDSVDLGPRVDILLGADKASGDSTGLANDATSGHQDWGFSVAKTAASASGLANDATVYTASVVIDGGAPQAISVVGSAAQTLQTLVDEINADLTGATASFEATGNGFIRITSDSVGGSSSVVITDTDIFASLTDANGAAESAVAGDDGTLYTLTYNNGSAQNFSVPGYQVQTVGELVTALQGFFTDVTITFASGNSYIRFQSDLAPSQAITLTDGNLVSSLFGGEASIDDVVDGSEGAIQIPVVANASVAYPSKNFGYVYEVLNSSGLRKFGFVSSYDRNTGILTIQDNGETSELAAGDVITVMGSFYTV